MTFVFTNGNYFAAIILKKIFEESSSDMQVILVKGDYYGNSKKKGLLIALKTVPVKYILYKIFVFFGISTIKIFKAGNYSVKHLCKKYNIPYFETVSANSNFVKEIINKQSHRYLVSVSCPQIIKSSTLKLFEHSINIHSSLLPKYAGLAPYFWVLNNQESITGTTVHYMVGKMDEGKIVVQKRLNIEEHWSMFTLFVKLSDLGSICLHDAYEQMKLGYEGIPQNLSLKTYYSNPSASDLNHFKKLGKKLIRLKDIFNIKPI